MQKFVDPYSNESLLEFYKRYYPDCREVFPEQNDKPETVFIFGAGASYPDGVPLQSDIIPIILGNDDLQIRKSEPGKLIRNFLIDNFSIDPVCPSLEEVFGFIDFHINNDFSLSKKWTVSEITKVKSALTKILHYVISSRTKKSEYFKLFWKRLCAENKKIAVITTNYDTLIDDAFDTIYGECLIDYCIDLVNYRYPKKIDSNNWWVNPKDPFISLEGNKPTRIKLLKIHGSLNWKYCNCCAQVTLTPWEHKINLKKDSYESFIESDITNCPFDKNKLSSLIQVPSHLKVNNNFIFNKLYDEAGYTIRNSKTLVFIGYSFPEADVHIRALVKRHFSPKSKIIVINKSRAQDLIHRYESLSDDVDYHQMTFERFLKSKVFNELLSTAIKKEESKEKVNLSD